MNIALSTMHYAVRKKRVLDYIGYRMSHIHKISRATRISAHDGPCFRAFESLRNAD